MEVARRGAVFLTSIAVLAACNPMPHAANPNTPPDCAGVTPAASAPSPSPTPGRVLTTTAQLAIFDRLVSTVESDYVYPDFHGVDWPAIAAGYRNQVQARIDTATFYDDMGNLMEALGDRHSQFLTPAEVEAVNAELAGDINYVGIGVSVQAIPSQHSATITGIDPGSTAARAGLKTHDTILTVDGQPALTSDGGPSPRFKGPRCSIETLTVASPGAPPRMATVFRDRVTGPELIDARLVKTSDGSRIGYIFLPTFADVTMPGQMAQALTRFGRLDALIVDVRENSGGLERILASILGYFTSGVAGQFVSRTATRAFRIESSPNSGSNTVPLAVLISPDTFSSAEFFAGILKDQGRARLVGEKTTGLIQSLHVLRLDDGSEAWIAEEGFDPAVSHADWATTGIVPDVQVSAGWETFTFETDPAIAAAVRLFGHR